MSAPSEKFPRLVDFATHVERPEQQARPAEPKQPVESGKIAAQPQDASGQMWADDAPLLSTEQPSGSYPDCARAPGRTPRPVDPSSTASKRATPPQTRCDKFTATPRETECIEDILHELKRRELAGTRLPRGPNLPPPEPLPVGSDAAGSILGRRAEILDGFKRRRSLEPTQLPPPPLQPIHNLRVILGISVACLGAAIACYYFFSAPSFQPTLNPQMASLPPSSEASIGTPQRANSRGPRLDREPDWAPRADARSDLPPAPDKKLPEGTSPQALIAPPERANAKPESAEEQTAILSASKPVRTLQPEEIRLLVEQGERFIKDGDIITARMLFERAAKAGDAAAALALAAAYDPIVLAKIGALGINTDVEKARIWYQKAQSLGSAQAGERLEALARR